MPITYILYSKKVDNFYLGACIDINRRLYEHNIGHSKFTSTGMPWEIVHQECFKTLPLAKKIELEIKKKKLRKYIVDLIGGFGS